MARVQEFCTHQEGPNRWGATSSNLPGLTKWHHFLTPLSLVKTGCACSHGDKGCSEKTLLCKSVEVFLVLCSCDFIKDRGNDRKMPQLCNVRGVKSNWIKIEKFCLFSGRPRAQIRGNWKIALNKCLVFSVLIFFPRNFLFSTEGKDGPWIKSWCPCNIKLGLAETNNPGLFFSC